MLLTLGLRVSAGHSHPTRPANQSMRRLHAVCQRQCRGGSIRTAKCCILIPAHIVRRHSVVYHNNNVAVRHLSHSLRRLPRNLILTPLEIWNARIRSLRHLASSDIKPVWRHNAGPECELPLVAPRVRDLPIVPYRPPQSLPVIRGPRCLDQWGQYAELWRRSTSAIKTCEAPAEVYSRRRR